MPIGLVGRGDEMAAIEARLGRARGGVGAVVFAVGPPGIGKSALLEHARDTAEQQGFAVAIGQCWEAGGAPAGWPFREALRGLGATAAMAAALDALAARSEQVYDLVPELAPSARAPALAEDLDPGRRFAIIDAVASLLGELSRRQPTLIALEDLHAADQLSIDLLRMVVKTAPNYPLMVVGSYRSREARMTPALADGLAACARSSTTLALAPLSVADAEALARSVDGTSAERAAEIVRSSEGNPLFVLELARSARGPASLSGIDHAITAHLEVLSPGARRAAELAAVFGRSVDEALWLRMMQDECGGSPSDWAQLHQELASAEVMTGSSNGRWSFVHILLRDSLYRSLDARRRARLHARAVDHLQALAAPSSEIAHHARAGAAVLGVAVAARLGHQAARAAAAQAAFGDAAEILAWVVALADSSEDVADGTRIDWHLDLAEAHIVGGQVSMGRERCVHMADRAEAIGDAERLARAALIYGLEFTSGTRDRRMIELLERALHRLDPAPSAIRVRVMARHATACYPAEDPQQPFQLAEQAIAMARELDDPRILRQVLWSTRLPMFFSSPAAEQRELDYEIIDLARRFAPPHELARDLMMTAIGFLAAGDMAQFEAVVAEAVALAERHRQPQYLFRAYLMRAMAACRTGDFSGAKRWRDQAERCVELGPIEPPIPIFLFTRMAHARLERDRAALAAMRGTLAQALLHNPNGYIQRAWLHAHFGEIDAARAELGRGNHRDLRGRPLAVLVFMTEIAIAVGDRALMENLYRHMRPFADEVVTWGMMGFNSEGVCATWLARLGRALGHHDQADTDFDRALLLDRQHGSWSALANTLEDRIADLIELGGEESLGRARALNQELIALLDRLGLSERAERARALFATGDNSPVDGQATGFTLMPLGDSYQASFAGRTFLLKAGKGLRYLELLMARAGTDIHVLELVAAESGSVAAGIESDAGCVVDETALAAYRQRLQDLSCELERAEQHNDLARAEALSTEREALLAELGRATGLGGRSRKEKSTAERARVNVQRRLRSAVLSIGKHSRGAEAFLDAALTTGLFCCYRPR